MSMNKTLILTGATSGLGLDLCYSLLDKGYTVYALGRNIQALPKHENCIAINCDLRKVDSIESTCLKLKEITNIEALLLFAGVGHFAYLEQLSFQQIDEMVDVNFKGHLRILKHLIPKLKKQKSGLIAFMGSEAGLEGQKQGSIYCATKFAIRGLSQAVKKECASSNIKVSLINPGMVKTPFYKNLHFEPGSDIANSINVKDVSASIHFLLNTDSGSNIDEINLSPLKKVVQKKALN